MGGATPIDRRSSFEFKVGPQALSVTRPGFFDEDSNGLITSHEVTLWDISGPRSRQ